MPLFRALPCLRVAQVAAGKHHSLALTEAGVYAWGDNRWAASRDMEGMKFPRFGQLGIGGAVSRSPTPRLVPCLGLVLGLAAGQFHSLARSVL